MAEINWNILAGSTPQFEGAIDYYRAGQKDNRLRRRDQALASGDIEALRAVDPEAAAALEKQRQGAADRQGRVAGAMAAANGDWQGGRDAYAAIGDIDGVAGVDKRQADHAKQTASEATFLQSILTKDGPGAALAAFDQRSPNWGMTPDQIADLRQKVAADPAQVLRALAGAANYQFKTGPNGGLIAINPATGEANEVVKGLPDAPSGYRFKADGMSQEYIPGGPADPLVIGGNAGVKRKAIVDQPMKTTGGKAKAGGGMKLPTGFILD